jgi:hypothetical protein
VEGGVYMGTGTFFLVERDLAQVVLDFLPVEPGNERRRKRWRKRKKLPRPLKKN